MGRNPGPATIALMLVFIGHFIGAGAPARADDDADRKQARALLDSGDRRMRRGDRHQRRGRTEQAASAYRQALESYQKAYELVPNPALFFAIGGAEEKLKRWLDAIEHYRVVVRDVESERLREQARERIAALEQYVAAVRFVVTPEGAEISIDRQLRGQAPLAGPVFLMPGDYRVTVTAPGHTPHEAVITVVAGKLDERTISLSETPVVVKKPKRMVVAPVPEDEDVPELRQEVPQAPSKTGVVIGASLTVGLLAGATATGLISLSKHGTFTDPATAPADREAVQDSGKRMALVTDGLIVGAVLTGAYTAYRYFLVYSPARAKYDARLRPSSSASTSSFWLVPYAAAAGGGLAAGGRF